MAVVSVAGGQGDRESAAAPLHAPPPAPPAVRARDLAADGQAEAAAAADAPAGAVDPIEAVEDVGQVGGGDAGAVVGDRDADLAVAAPLGDADLAFRRHEADGVVDE